MNGLLLPFAAIAAGVVSASSPCVLPVLPGYIAAVSATDTDDGGRRPRARIIGAFGFVGGFTIVFTVLGATASALGGLLYEQLDSALRVAGVVLIVFGLHTLNVFRWSALAGERRPVAMHLVGRGPRRAVGLGAAFALGWTPCIGPILATILTKAAADAKKNMIKVPVYKGTIPHEQKGKFGAGRVLIRPAAAGTGVIAGGSMRAVLEIAGVHNVLAKSMGSSNPHNVVKATLDALSKLRSPIDISKQRGMTLENVFNG